MRVNISEHVMVQQSGSKGVLKGNPCDTAVISKEVQYDLFSQQSLVVFLERCRVQPISGAEINILSLKCVPVLTNSNTSSIIVLHIEYRICTLIKTTFR